MPETDNSAAAMEIARIFSCRDLFGKAAFFNNECWWANRAFVTRSAFWALDGGG